MSGARGGRLVYGAGNGTTAPGTCVSGVVVVAPAFGLGIGHEPGLAEVPWCLPVDGRVGGAHQCRQVGAPDAVACGGAEESASGNKSSLWGTGQVMRRVRCSRRALVPGFDAGEGGEFVASEAACDIVASGPSGQSAADRGECDVTGRVSVPVVALFEVVGVCEDQDHLVAVVVKEALRGR